MTAAKALAVSCSNFTAEFPNPMHAKFAILAVFLQKEAFMDFDSRIGSFIKLGKRLRESGKGLLQDPMDVMEQAIAKAIASNPWFTGSAVRYALESLGDALVEENIHRWLEPYKDRINRQTGLKTVAVVMAGNIPAVGFHDLLSVLITGQRLQARLSSSDEHLLPAMAHILQAEDKGWTERILFSGKIQRPFDAVIATGNDNSARHFTEYFGQYPHIIRKNRTSVAVLKGDETLHQLTSLADDCMLHFGLGCRSVTRLLVPEGYDFSLLIKSFDKYRSFLDHTRYHNNYIYNRSLCLLNNSPFLDTGFLILREQEDLTSRIAEIHYSFYRNIAEVTDFIRQQSDGIQCVVGDHSLPFVTVLFGETQKPALWQYADGVDTLDFLLS